MPHVPHPIKALYLVETPPYPPYKVQIRLLKTIQIITNQILKQMAQPLQTHERYRIGGVI